MRSRTALLGTLVLATALILVSPRLALTPGPLTAGHAAFANDCLSCHTILRSAPPPKCVACHPLDSIGISRRVLVQPVKARPALAGLHSEIRNADCLDCHTDHLGPDPAQATHAFSHEALGPERRQRCSGCHKSDRPADELHRQMGEDCTSCHTTQAWTPATFEHEQHFVLDRDHLPHRAGKLPAVHLLWLPCPHAGRDRRATPRGGNYESARLRTLSPVG